MNSGWKRVVTLVATLGLASCIAHRPTRTFDEVNHVEPRTECLTATAGLTSIAKLSVQGSAGDPERVRVGCMSDEDHEPEQGRFPHSGFKLHVFEFDDDGVPWNAEGQRASLEKLTKELNDRRSLVAAFVHGWKNDAEVCNDNLACFREVLRLLAKGETSFAGPTARQVVGVYIGWRGGTIRAKGVKQLTFWGRKHTAHAIGDNGAVTAVIERLRTIVDESKKKRSTSADTLQDTSMVFVGHSFGAALLFSALIDLAERQRWQGDSARGTADDRSNLDEAGAGGAAAHLGQSGLRRLGGGPRRTREPGDGGLALREPRADS